MNSIDKVLREIHDYIDERIVNLSVCDRWEVLINLSEDLAIEAEGAEAEMKDEEQ